MRLLKLIPDNTNIPFMRWRNAALALSLLLIAASLGLLATRGLNLGVDFNGGQMIRATFDRPAPIEDVRSRIGDLGLGDATIQEFGDPRTVTIRLALPQGEGASVGRRPPWVAGGRSA